MEIQESTREYRRRNYNTYKPKNKKSKNTGMNLMLCLVIIMITGGGDLFKIGNVVEINKKLKKLISSEITEESLEKNLVGRAILDLKKNINEEFADDDQEIENIAIDNINEIDMKIDNNYRVNDKVIDEINNLINDTSIENNTIIEKK